jgi:hypothetical protein
MAGLPNVIGLIYRADWTRLSLSAEVRFESDGDLLRRRVRDRWSRAWPVQEENDGRYSMRAALLIAPGGRWRLDYAGSQGLAEGNDGERGWEWRPPGMAPPVPLDPAGAYAPVPDLFCPSCLLGGYTLEDLGPLTACGRGVIAVAATPRRDALRSDPGDRFHDRVEVAVDAELGIVLRRAETSRGELLSFTELTDLTMNPPDATRPARFAAPPGSHRIESLRENVRQTLGGPGWDTARNAAGLAAGGLGALIRLGSHLPGHGEANEHMVAAMP